LDSLIYEILGSPFRFLERIIVQDEGQYLSHPARQGIKLLRKNLLGSLDLHQIGFDSRIYSLNATP